MCRCVHCWERGGLFSCFNFVCVCVLGWAVCHYPLSVTVCVWVCVCVCVCVCAHACMCHTCVCVCVRARVFECVTVRVCELDFLSRREVCHKSCTEKGRTYCIQIDGRRPAVTVVYRTLLRFWTSSRLSQSHYNGGQKGYHIAWNPLPLTKPNPFFVEFLDDPWREAEVVAWFFFFFF